MYFLRLLGQAFRLWFRRGADESAAALAYFMPFALTPLIILSISIVGIIYGVERVTAMLVRWGNSIDPGVTDLVSSSVENFDAVATHYYWPMIGFVFLSIMIYITLNSLMVGFHKLWEVESYGWRNFLSRLWRITLFIGVLQCYLVGIIILEDTLAFAASVTGLTLWPILSFFTGLLLTILLLSIAYGLLALRAPSFSGRFVGAAVAGLFLLFSRELVAFHFTTAPVQTLFGAAGLLITLLVWVYVAAGIILYGAAFARVFDEARGLRQPRD
ncbi:MAG: YihY/virulence factor BrkB family protein [Candidatus Pacebacteria bacterium]|jgi:membrane protein|nr:YihY/virulence factor BrkB family protein [Candidatus Paceibacterota bacterium]